MMMKRVLLLVINLVVMYNIVFAQGDKMRLTIDLRNAILEERVEVKGNDWRKEIVVEDDKK